MDSKKTLSLGWVTAIAFILGSLILGSQLNDYSAISQTVSEIGEKDSPLYIHWQIFSAGIGCLLILFAIGIISFAKKRNLSTVPGILILFFGFLNFLLAFFLLPIPCTMFLAFQ